MASAFPRAAHAGTPVRDSPELIAVAIIMRAKTFWSQSRSTALPLLRSRLSFPPSRVVVCRHPWSRDGYNSCGEKTVLFIRLVFSDGNAPDYCTEAQVADIMWTKGSSNPVHANAMFRASSCRFRPEPHVWPSNSLTSLPAQWRAGFCRAEAVLYRQQMLNSRSSGTIYLNC